MNAQFLNRLLLCLFELLPLAKHELSMAIDESDMKIQQWMKTLPASTSEINIRLYFMQLLSEKIKINNILCNEKLLSVLLDDIGIRKVGDYIKHKGKDWKVIGRKIGKNYGIEFSLKNNDGEMVSWEFFD